MEVLESIIPMPRIGDKAPEFKDVRSRFNFVSSWGFYLTA